MTSLTKDQLKTALITHGVELPSPSARKEEYLRLYEEFVAPTEKSKSDFSSDEEDLLPVEQNKVNMDQSLIVDGFDISTLSDDDLYSRLMELGATVGPVVDSTRKVYERKLFVLMGGDVSDSPPPYSGDVDEEEEYSDSEVEEDDVEEVEEPVKTRSSSRLESSKASPSTQNKDLRKRVFVTSDERGNVVFDPDRHTPSPRPSLRSVTSSVKSNVETFRIGKYVNNGGSGMINATRPVTLSEQEEEKDRQSKKSLVVRLIVKLLFLALIIALFYYVYQNDNSESPFKTLEHMAKQALEAAVGEDAEMPAEETAGKIAEEPEAARAL